MNVVVTIHTTTGRTVIVDPAENVTEEQLEDFYVLGQNFKSLKYLRATCGGDEVFFNPECVESIEIGQR